MSAKESAIKFIASQKREQADSEARIRQQQRLFQQQRAERAAAEERRIAQYRRDLTSLKNQYAYLINSKKKSARDYITPDFALTLAEQYKRDAGGDMLNALRIAIQKEQEPKEIFKNPEIVKSSPKKTVEVATLQNILNRAKFSKRIADGYKKLGNWKVYFLNQGGDESSDSYKQGFNDEIVGMEEDKKSLDEYGGPLNEEEMKIAIEQGFKAEDLTQTTVPKRLTRGKGRKRGGMKTNYALEVEDLLNFVNFVHYDAGMDVVISHNPILLQIQRILEEHSNASERRNIKKYFIDGLFNIWNTEGITILEIRRKINTIFDPDFQSFILESRNLNQTEKNTYLDFVHDLILSDDFLSKDEQIELGEKMLTIFYLLIKAVLERDGMHMKPPKKVEHPPGPIIPSRKPEKPEDEEDVHGGVMPSDSDVSQQIAKQSYNLTDPQKDINGWMLADWSPNLKIYTKGTDAILGVRGTKTAEDVSVWGTIPLSTLGTTDLYKRIEKELMDFKSKHPEITEYYAVGHSLGGALIDVMLRKGLVKEAVSFNPAIQYNDINGGLANRRIYFGADPLYKLMGWWDKKSEHRDTDLFSKFISAMVDSPLNNVLSAHNLSNFKGGKRCRKCGLMK